MGKSFDKNQAIDATSKMHGGPQNTGICMKNDHTRMIEISIERFEMKFLVKVLSNLH